MITKRLLFMLLLSSASFALEMTGEQENNTTSCRDEESCINDDNCQCYCSVKCGFRKKDMKSDRPVYIKNDPNGKYCYCKQWDADYYNKRHCDVKEKSTMKEKAKSSKKKQN